MATLTSSLIVRLLDQVTKPAKGVARALTGIGEAARSASGISIGQRLTGAIERNNEALADTRGRLVDAVGGFYLLKQGLGAAIRPAVSFESAMADVAKVTNFSDSGLADYGKSLRKLASSEIPMAVDELAALSAAAAQSGVPETDLLDFTRLTAKSAVAWEMTGAVAGEALAKIRTALGLTNEQTALYADAINHLSDNTASSAPDLVDFSRRVASQGEFFGFAKEETLAFGAAMVSAGAESEVAATSFRNMGRALTKGASATKAQRRAYKSLGLEATKVAKAMQDDAVGTTLDVIERLGKLPEHMQASVMSDLFGDEARALAPLLSNAELLRNALKLVGDETAYANSVGREFERRAQTSAYAWQRFKSQLNDIALSIGGALLPALKEIMATLGPIVLKVSEFVEANPKLTAAVIGTTAALIGLRVGLIGLQWAGLMAKGGLLSAALGVVNLGSGIRSVAAFLAAPFIGALTRAIGVMQIANMRFRMMGAAARAGEIGLLGMAQGTLATVGRALLGLLNPLGIVRAAFTALKFAVIGTGIGAAVLAIAAAGTWIYNNWSGLVSFFEGFGTGLMNALAPVMPVIQPVVDGVSWLADKFRALTGDIGASEGQWRSWGETVGGIVGNAIRKLIDLFGSLANGIRNAWNSAKNFLGFGGGGGGASSAPAEGGGSIAGARAKGGDVFSGRSYLVGEEGPEIFTPGRNGHITPNGGGSAPPISAQVTLHVHGVTDLQEIVNRAVGELERAVRHSLQGVYADMRLT